MTEKVSNIEAETGRESTLPTSENAATVPSEQIAPTAPPPPAKEAAESKTGGTAEGEAELPVVAKVPAPKIERTEAQMRHAAQLASQEWHVARAPQGDIFGRRIAAAESTYRQVFNELDRRPMPTYKPGEPLDPLLELRENPRLLQSALDEMHSIRRRLMRLPVVVRPREGDEPRIVTVADTYLKASDSRWDSEWVVWFLEEVQKADPLTLRELWAFPTAVKFLLVEEVLTQAKSQIEDPAAFDIAAQGLLAARFDGIRNAIYANWAQMIEGLVVFNAVLRQDPVGSYPRMDFDSRERYRERVSEIARHSDLSELEVAQAALRPGPEAGAGEHGATAGGAAHACWLLPDRQGLSAAGRRSRLPAAVDRPCAHLRPAQCGRCLHPRHPDAHRGADRGDHGAAGAELLDRRRTDGGVSLPVDPDGARRGGPGQQHGRRALQGCGAAEAGVPEGPAAGADDPGGDSHTAA